MLRERTRFEHEVQLLAGATANSFEVPYFSEGKQVKSGPTGSHVFARILWPALGFPAVIAPRDKESMKLFPEGDVTACICLLLLSDRHNLTPEDVARYLRYVPWEKRHFNRHIQYIDGQVGTFRKSDLKVLKPHEGGAFDGLGELVFFGANHKGENGIAASLAKDVREFYRNIGLKFLFEIRVNEITSRQLSAGQYHLFWNNQGVSEDVPSDEMNQLINRFALPQRKIWEENVNILKREYEYEYGLLHLPYKSKHGKREPRFRSEILHPLFIIDRAAVLRVSHLTDTHVDVRANVYHENLKRLGPESEVSKAYNNWNDSFLEIYSKAKGDSDVLLLTGDLIDYGRGFIGAERREDLADNKLYHPDRNWFLFYYLLASDLGSDKPQYTKPVYTCLGNHDWRLNPYPPFAFAGAPSPRALFDEVYLNKLNIGRLKDLEGYLKLAHGPGHELLLSYDESVKSKWDPALQRLKKKIDPDANFWGIIEAIKKYGPAAKLAILEKDLPVLKQLFMGGAEKIDIKGWPIETNIESVEWYLLSINPFLNYQFAFPDGYSVLMLDWEEDENVLFDNSSNGMYEGWGVSIDEGPKARNSLSVLQKKLIENFTEAPGKAKIIGIHAPPIGPWHDWYDDELLRGWNEYDPGGRGYQRYRAKFPDGNTVEGHPFFAFKPKKGVVEGAVFGMDATYGSFEKDKDWFIKRLADQKYHVRIILSGHIHRSGLFITYELSSMAGEMLIKSIDPIKTSGLAPSTGPERFGLKDGPLYINSTSIGPRGHKYRSDKYSKQHIKKGLEALEKGDKKTANTHLTSVKHIMPEWSAEATNLFELVKKELSSGNTKGAIFNLRNLYNVLGKGKYIPPGYTYLQLLNNGFIHKVVFRSL